MHEFKSDTFVLDNYLKILELEKILEDYSIDLSETGYYPEVYPWLIRDLGSVLAASGKMKEAMDLSGDLISAVYELTGSAITANYYGTLYCVLLCLDKDDSESALALWENFERYLDEHKEDYSDEELDTMKLRIDILKKEISGQK